VSVLLLLLQGPTPGALQEMLDSIDKQTEQVGFKLSGCAAGTCLHQLCVLGANCHTEPNVLNVQLMLGMQLAHKLHALCCPFCACCLQVRSDLFYNVMSSLAGSADPSVLKAMASLDGISSNSGTEQWVAHHANKYM
jgi:hypothetical protein